MKGKRRGFTLIELLTVIAIIALLLSLAVPALNEARMRARIVGDQASLRVVNDAVENFANDMGFYPDSYHGQGMLLKQQPAGAPLFNPVPDYDQGAHTLFEALAGLDHIGYQKDHVYVIDPDTGVPSVYDADRRRVETKRWGPYLKLESVNIGTMQEAHKNSTVFVNNNNPIFMDTLDVQDTRAILYYKANPSRHLISQVYRYRDNAGITSDKDQNSGLYYHWDEVQDQNISTPPDFAGDPTYSYAVPYSDRIYFWDKFIKSIWNKDTGDNSAVPYASATARPHNQSSFILINAGRDHRYFTEDDITNYK